MFLNGTEEESDAGEDDDEQNGEQDYEAAEGDEDYEDTAKQGGNSYQSQPSHPHRQKRKKVFVPVFVPEKEKKKSKCLTISHLLCCMILLMTVDRIGQSFTHS
jgi:hypothetical protein